MRTAYSLLPTLTAFLAFVLGLLCLFSGSTKQLAVADLFTLYTPTIGNGTGMHDYYSMYIMGYCEGFTLDDAATNQTGCSNRTMLFSFDPEVVFAKETGNKTSLSKLGWPETVTEDFQSFRVTSRGMGVFYCIGVGFAALAMAARLVGVVSKGPRQSAVELFLLLLSFTMLSITSIIATVIAFQFVDLINSHGESSDVSAVYGRTFLGMTWASVGLLLLGSIASLVMVMLDRRAPPQAGAVQPVEKSALLEDHESVRSRI